MIKRLLFIAAALFNIEAIAQCTDQVTATYSPQTVCTGKDVQLSASNVAGATYSWTGPNSYSSSAQNTVIPAITLAGAGDYIVSATSGSCVYLDTVTITPNPTPPLPIVTQNGPICEGDTITMMATNTPATSYYYYWFGPDSFIALTITAQDVNIFNASVAKSGIYKIIAEAPATGCRSDTSYINVVVNPNLIPNVFITAADSTTTGPMVPITFTANVTNAGTNPTYQWQKNSVDIPGATSQTYTGINGFDFQHYDTIGVRVAADASDPCPQTTFSNRLIVRINLGVDDLYDTPSFGLYPNPNNGRFTISGLPLHQSSGISVINAFGQVVYSTVAEKHNGSISITTGDLPDGVYLIQVKTGDVKQNLRFTQQH